MGEFADNVRVVGATSAASYNVVTFNPMEAPAAKENYDNQIIETQASVYVVKTEKNAMGEI